MAKITGRETAAAENALEGKSLSIISGPHEVEVRVAVVSVGSTSISLDGDDAPAAITGAKIAPAADGVYANGTVNLFSGQLPTKTFVAGGTGLSDAALDESTVVYRGGVNGLGQQQLKLPAPPAAGVVLWSFEQRQIG